MRLQGNKCIGHKWSDRSPQVDQEPPLRWLGIALDFAAAQIAGVVSSQRVSWGCTFCRLPWHGHWLYPRGVSFKERGNMAQTFLPALRMCKRCLEPHRSRCMLALLTIRRSLNTQHVSKAHSTLEKMLTTLKRQPRVTYLPRVSNQRPPPAVLEQRSPQAIAHLMGTLCSDSETFCLCGRSLWNHQKRNSAFNSISGGELARQSERTLQAVLRVAKAAQAIQQA